HIINIVDGSGQIKFFSQIYPSFAVHPIICEFSVKNISGLFPFVAVYRLWIVSARLLVSGKT
ncbi:MAG: hypothetical protein ACE5HR_07715, partial [bacterium]